MAPFYQVRSNYPGAYVLDCNGRDLSEKPVSIPSEFPCEQVIDSLSTLFRGWSSTDLYKQDHYTVYQSLIRGLLIWPGGVRVDSAQYKLGRGPAQVHAFVLTHGQQKYVLGLKGERSWNEMVERIEHQSAFGVEYHFLTQMSLPDANQRVSEAALTGAYEKEIQSVIEKALLQVSTPTFPSAPKSPRL